MHPAQRTTAAATGAALALTAVALALIDAAPYQNTPLPAPPLTLDRSTTLTPSPSAAADPTNTARLAPQANPFLPSPQPDPAPTLPADASIDPPASAPPPLDPGCTAELRSWVVAFRGRHLFLQIDCPEPFDHLDGRVEYTAVFMRRDYDRGSDRSSAPVVSRMTRGVHIWPPPGAPTPDNRLEAEYDLSLDQARCLQHDRLYSGAYVLLGANSSAGLRAAMEACGIDMPAHVTAAGGPLGEFPGIRFSPGDEIDPDDWPAFGLPNGPTTATQPESTISPAGDVATQPNAAENAPPN